MSTTDLAPFSRQYLIVGMAPSMLRRRRTRVRSHARAAVACGHRARRAAGAPRSVGDHRGVLLVLRHVKIDANEDALARDVEAREGDLLHGHSVRVCAGKGRRLSGEDACRTACAHQRDTSMHFLVAHSATTFFGTSLICGDQT